MVYIQLEYDIGVFVWYRVTKYFYWYVVDMVGKGGVLYGNKSLLCMPLLRVLGLPTL